jgi:hypothetical protein
VLTPAGLEKSVGLITTAYHKDASDSRWANDPAMKQWTEFMKKYYPEGNQADVSRAADLLVHVVGIQSVAEVVNSTGSLSPAHRQVAFSEDYLRPDLQPSRSSVFTAEQRYVHLLPVLEVWDELEELAAEYLERLLTAPSLSVEEIEAVLVELDEASRALLDPDYEEFEEEPDDETESPDDEEEGAGDS